MSFNFKWYPLEELATIKYGKNQKKVQDNENGKYPIYGTGGIMGYANDYLYNKPSVLIGRKGSISKVKYVDYPFWTVDTLFYTQIKEDKVIPKYLYYNMSLTNFNFYNEGTTIPSLRTDTLNKIEFLIPPIEEQKAIAKILSDLDNKIEVNNKINKRLEDMAQTIFKHWFVDFEFPNDEGKPYKSSGGEMIESELGMIPKGWEISSLSKIANYLNGLAMQKFRPEQDKESLKVMKIKELRQRAIDNNSDLCSINIDGKYIVKDGDVIFSWSGSLIVDIWCGGECGLNQHLFKVTSEIYNKWFYYMWTKYHLSEFIKIAEGKATTMGHIKRSELDAAKVLIPNETCLEYMDLIFDNIIAKIIKVNIESRKLKNLRDTLLPKLMSGEIRVPID